jgi:hypothetical protein
MKNTKITSKTRKIDLKSDQNMDLKLLDPGIYYTKEGMIIVHYVNML